MNRERNAAPTGFAQRTLHSVPPSALVVVGIISLQVGAAFAKQLFALAGPSGAVTLRLGFAAIVLLVVWRPSLRWEWRTLAVIAMYGAVLAGMNILIYQSFSRIPLGVAVTIEFLGPLAVAVFGSRRLFDLVWAGLAALGVVLLAQVGGGLDPIGVLFAVLAGTLWAGYILLGAKLGDRTSGGAGLALGMTFGTLVALPFGVAEAGIAVFSPGVLLAGLAVALLSSVVPYSLELEALRRMPPRVFGVLMSLEPAIAALAGLIVLGEALSLVQWVAVGCVVVASVGAARSGKRHVQESTPSSADERAD